MVDKTDVWLQTLIWALPSLGETRAVESAHRVAAEFEKHFAEAKNVKPEESGRLVSVAASMSPKPSEK